MAVALALIASLCWGVADFMGGSLSRRHPLGVVVLVSQAVGLAGVVEGAAVRSGGYHPGAGLPGVLAGLAGVAAVSSFYRSMTLGAISVAAPILATSAVVRVAVALPTGERPSAVQLAGIGAALAGVALVSREPSAGGGTVRGAGVTLALVAALALGLQLVALDNAARADPLWGVATARLTSVTAFAAAALVVRPAFARAALPALVLVGLLDVTANAGFAVATTHGYLSIVAVLGSLFPLVTVALARAAARAPQQRSAGRRRPGAGWGGRDRRRVMTNPRGIGAAVGRPRPCSSRRPSGRASSAPRLRSSPAPASAALPPRTGASRSAGLHGPRLRAAPALRRRRGEPCTARWGSPACRGSG